MSNYVSDESNSYVNQLILITRNIYCGFDPNRKGVFLFLLKTFDKVWHKGGSYKLENNEVHALHLDDLFL